jgi:hypothetical protein
MSGHTPGPWTVQSASWSEEGNIQYEIAGIPIMNRLDARLIEAAPDLLDALENLVRLWQWGADLRDYSTPWNGANEAIAKARGTLVQS